MNIQPILFETAQPPTVAPIFPERLRIYMGLLGQIGDIIGFSAVVRRVKQLYPNSSITLAVSARYREAGELLAGLPYIDRLFVTQLYFEKFTPALFQPWERGWPLDLRGEDEVREERMHDIVLPTRARHWREPWWQFAHAVEELAHMTGVPGPIDCRTEISIPAGTSIPENARGKIVLHNDPTTDPRKAWPWEKLARFVDEIGPNRCVILGRPGPPLNDAADLRGKTSLAQAAAIIRDCCCYLGIDSGLMWIAGSLQVPTVGLYGSDYVGRPDAVQPVNQNAIYLNSPAGLEEISVEQVAQAVRRQTGGSNDHPR